MRVLALDTSTRITTVALLDGERLLGLFHEPAANHSKSLVTAMDQLIRQAKLSPQDLEAVAVGIGPGSFTGVRIGMTVAKTLAHTAKLPLVGISSLRALAENGRSLGGWICTASDALKEEIYCAQYDLSDVAGRTVQAEGARDPAVWAASLAAATGQPVLLGSGVERYRDILTEALGDRGLIPSDPALHQVSAQAIGRLALARLRAGPGDNPLVLEPLYCRLSEAELSRRRKGKGTGA